MFEQTDQCLAYRLFVFHHQRVLSGGNSAFLRVNLDAPGRIAKSFLIKANSSKLNPLTIVARSWLVTPYEVKHRYFDSAKTIVHTIPTLTNFRELTNPAHADLYFAASNETLTSA
ncbi:unnamed protein product [Clonostachys rhizophaga]|uniref:Uncharacterized protein n=1 Tax=Clonostachys rhizophaga TaxID=160324 RepID=A0A9N9VQW9_9HYPO|nr:unnamed protein product [Clonostachys rhizophaga]